jgi:hypothetical protein
MARTGYCGKLDRPESRSFEIPRYRTGPELSPNSLEVRLCLSNVLVPEPFQG